MTDDTLRKFTRDELLIVAARTGKSIIFDIETDAGDRSVFYIIDDPHAPIDREPIPAPVPLFEPREKPSHKLTTFERMQQGQRSKRDMIRRAMERRS